MAVERVMAGLRLAPGLPNAWATTTPQRTAMAHPVVTTIQPASDAKVRRRVTLAQTPLPRRMRTRVPRNSPNQTECMFSFLYECGMSVADEEGIGQSEPGLLLVPHVLIAKLGFENG